MNKVIVAAVFGASALVASTSALARVSVSVGINPFGYGALPPPAVVYQPPTVYAPPPAVYVGGGVWGGDHGRRFDHRHDDHRHDVRHR